MLRRVFLTSPALLVPALAADPAKPGGSGRVPRPSPEFAANLPGGGQFLLSQYRGKVVAVEFLLTTCPHCQECARHLETLQREFGPRGFQALGVAVNEPALQLVPGFVKSQGLTFPVGAAPALESMYQYLELSMMSRPLMPQVAFLDRKGTIVAQYAGNDPFMASDQLEKNLRAQVEGMLKAAPAGKPAAKGRRNS